MTYVNRWLIRSIVAYLFLYRSIAIAGPTPKLPEQRLSRSFSYEYYNEIKKNPGNLLFSPYSIATAMGMVYEGAIGKTAEEIRDVFQIPANDSDRFARIKHTGDIFFSKDPDVKIKIANGVWFEKSYPLNPVFAKKLSLHFHVKVAKVDFRKNSEKARSNINRWVNDNTAQRIKEIAPKGQITPQTRLVLANAIYFKAKWHYPFPKDRTKEGEFEIEPAKKVSVDLMRMQEDLPYGETSEYQFIELPYKNKQFALLVVLPRSKDIRVLENKLSDAEIKRIRDNLQNRSVDVILPKFKYDSTSDLQDGLKKLGIATIYDREKSDLSAITDPVQSEKERLYVDLSIHKAFIEVDEEGTEAAAVTAMGAEGGAWQEPKEFKANHPFIFFLIHRDSSEILFMGKVVNPSSHS